MAMTATHIAAATAALTWMFAEWAQHGKPTLVGIATGAIAGLATITPASGFVGPFGALVIGVAAGLICYLAVSLVKQRLEIDDSLDVFAVHGVGGAVGVVLTSFLAATTFGGLGLAEGFSIGKHLWVQLVGVAATAVWAGVLSYVIIKIVSAIAGLRVSEEEETEGLDITTHGERGYEI
jgi:Amt family ammonium transporter